MRKLITTCMWEEGDKTYYQCGASQVIERWRIHLPTQETQVWYLRREDPLEEKMATHSSILPWEIPRTEEPGGLQAMGWQRVRYDGAHTHAHVISVAPTI